MNLEQALYFFGLPSLEGQNESDLKRIYYRLAQVYHPDKGGSFEKFIYLQEAHLFLKKQLNNKSNFEESYSSGTNTSYQANSNNSSDQNYQDLLIRFGQLREHYAYTASVIEKYENIFNTQIGIINRSNDLIKKHFDNYNFLKNQLKNNMETRLNQLKKSYEKAWYEYILPTKKLTQQQYIQASNQVIVEFNQNSQFIDEEFVAQMLKLYQGSFQDLVVLLGDI